DGQAVEQARVVGDVGEVVLGLDGVRLDVEAGDGQVAAGGLEDAGQGPQGGRLAGAVGAGQAEHLAGLNLEGDALDGDSLAVDLVKVLDDDAHAHPPCLPACHSGWPWQALLLVASDCHPGTCNMNCGAPASPPPSLGTATPSGSVYAR